MCETEDPLSKEEQYQKLKACSDNKNIDDWNKWRKQQTSLINLSGFNLSGMWLKGVNLSYANLEEADLSYAHLESSDLASVNFKNANLTETHMERDFNAPLTKFNDRTNFEGANLDNTHMQGTQIFNPNFTNTTFSGTHFEEARLTHAHFEKASFQFENVHFEGANLYRADFTGVIMYNIHFEKSLTGKRTELKDVTFKNASIHNTNFANADMNHVNLTDATIWEADIEGADLRYANLEGTSFSGDKVKTNLKGTDFTGATVDGNTIIQTCNIDEKTNFTMVGLDSARIEPSLLAALKTSIRHIAWKKYYDEHGESFCDKIKTYPIHLFWWLSDYGSNTARIFKAFLCISLFFTMVYLIIAFINQDLAVLSNFNITGNWWLNTTSAFCFAVSTMVTLGFGGINVIIQECSPWRTIFALITVTFNLIAGYLILAVLVTRLGILFQSLAPEQKIVKTKIK